MKYSAVCRLRVSLAAAVILAGLGVAACAPSTPPAASDLEAVRARGRLIMLAWPHQESTFVRRMIKEYGEEGLDRFAGIDVDLMQRFAAHLGVELEVKPVGEGFSSLVPSLLAGDGDLVASSMTITEARKAKVDFSAPYFAVGLVVLVPIESPVQGVDDIAGLTAATVRGSSHEEHLRRVGFDDAHLFYVDFTLENYQAVAYGDADLTVVDSGSAATVLPQYAALGERLRQAFDLPDKDYYGIAVRPGSDLRQALDEFLAQEKAAGRLPGLTG